MRTKLEQRNIDIAGVYKYNEIIPKENERDVSKCEKGIDAIDTIISILGKVTESDYLLLVYKSSVHGAPRYISIYPIPGSGEVAVSIGAEFVDKTKRGNAAIASIIELLTARKANLNERIAYWAEDVNV